MEKASNIIPLIQTESIKFLDEKNCNFSIEVCYNSGDKPSKKTIAEAMAEFLEKYPD